jgi:2-polyprenyl-3-methyl-5-hydroxy-6-metoxy-1,4-benzoquinol methylase
MDKPYYYAYENRYQKVYAAGGNRWGHSPDDDVLFSTLSKWVKDNKLQGKRIIEFGCGEGAGGEILSELGCIYHGVDISPTVIEKTTIALQKFPSATVSVFDMVNDVIMDKYDGAIDIMAFHMLILDNDRQKYLKNIFNGLNNNAPIVFFRELHNENALNENISTMKQWLSITGNDYITPKIKHIHQNGIKIDVELPYVPGRERSKKGYIQEMTEAGFTIENFIEMEPSNQVQNSATIFARK